MNNAVEQYPGQIKELEDRISLVEEIFRGERVVLPVSVEHAKMMIDVANRYIEENHVE